MDVEIRQNVGVRNPYALMALKSSLKKGWWRAKSLEDAKKDFQKKFNKPFEKLFDPINDSPLYHGLPGVFGTAVQAHVGAKTDCTNLLSAWKRRDEWIYYNPTLDWFDPIQGCVANCFLISALSSLAWVCPGLMPRVTGRDSNNVPFDQYKFYPSGGAQPTSVTVTEQLPVNANEELVYATSYTQNEIWPSVYEKAYAKFWGCPVIDGDGDKPDISQMCSGNPLTALVNLTGLGAVAHLTQEFNSGSDLFVALSSLTEGSKCKFPMVGWTHPTAPDGSGISFTSDQIVANHSYSILGTYIDPATSKKCIVLRNPFGPNMGDPNVPGVLSGTWTYNLAYFRQGGVRITIPVKRTLDLTLADGVFAFDSDEFIKYFEAFGYVT